MTREKFREQDLGELRAQRQRGSFADWQRGG